MPELSIPPLCPTDAACDRTDAADDNALQQRVRRLLQHHPHLPRHAQVRCETAHGRVILRGRVSSYYQKQMAQETVRALAGVSEVENHLEVCRV